MDFMQAVKTVLNNYANFKDRSRRSEYWWWFLAYIIGYAVAMLVGSMLSMAELIAGIYALGLIIPNIALSIRRFHDIGKSGWWMLIFIIPLIGFIAMIYFFTRPSEGPNQYGEGPLAPAN